MKTKNGVIRRKRETLAKKQAELFAKITALQKECKHPNLTGKYQGDSGNWSSSDDYYWVEFVCPDCEKRWSEEQQKEVHYDSNLKQMVTKDGLPFTEVK